MIRLRRRTTTPTTIPTILCEIEDDFPAWIVLIALVQFYVQLKKCSLGSLYCNLLLKKTNSLVKIHLLEC